jgi:hypothetical protein
LKSEKALLDSNCYKTNKYLVYERGEAVNCHKMDKYYCGYSFYLPLFKKLVNKTDG